MAAGSFPGLDSKGYHDPSSCLMPSFANAAARDAWVTAQGGTTALPTGYQCLLIDANTVTVWNGAAWRTVATT